jgi:hypothetical protein
MNPSAGMNLRRDLGLGDFFDGGSGSFSFFLLALS